MVNLTEGLQTLSSVISTALGTLAAQTALQVGNDYESIQRPFLCRKLHYRVGLFDTPVEKEDVIIGIASAGFNVTEIKTALETALIDPDDPTNLADMGRKMGIWWQSLRLLNALGDGLNEEIKIGGKSGIPILEGTTNGVQVFVYNPNGITALTTGSSVAGVVMFQGVWLNG